MTLVPAPGRGQYDRKLPREQRVLEQRTRLLAAVAQVGWEKAEPALADVVAAAGVGRNTFYEYFDDVAHARREAESAVLRRLEERLRAVEARARTPVERFRALARAWFESVEAEPAESMLVLAGQGKRSSRASEVLHAALGRWSAAWSAAGTQAGGDSPRVLAVVAAGEVFARAFAAHLLGGADLTLRSSEERQRWELALVDVAVRLLR